METRSGNPIAQTNHQQQSTGEGLLEQLTDLRIVVVVVVVAKKRGRGEKSGWWWW